MSLVFIVWLVTTFIPSVSVLLALITIAGVIGMALLIMYAWTAGKPEPLFKFLSYKKTIVSVLFLVCVIPSQESMWYILGAYGTQKLVENPVALDIASDGVDVLKALMKKAKDSLEEPKKEAK